MGNSLFCSVTCVMLYRCTDTTVLQLAVTAVSWILRPVTKTTLLFVFFCSTMLFYWEFFQAFIASNTKLTFSVKILPISSTTQSFPEPNCRIFVKLVMKAGLSVISMVVFIVELSFLYLFGQK